MLDTIKLIISDRLPHLIALKKRLAYWRYRHMDIKAVFTDIYHRNRWGSAESLSGMGSELVASESIRAALPELLKKINARSLLDAPCGDFHWMNRVDLSVDEYIGVDIVPEIIATNNSRYGSASVRFSVLNIVKDSLPAVDLIMCRDCLIHFSYDDAFAALANFKKSGSKYLLTTTYSACRRNIDITTGSWRPINLQLPPFNFPLPDELIEESSSGGHAEFFRKCLGLWRLDAIPRRGPA